MTLRIMLVGLVASMGFELPSGPEVSTWAMSSRDWVHARLADLSGPVVEADLPDAEPTGCHQADASASIVPPAIPGETEADDDATFLAASEAMAADFAADLVTARDEPSPDEPSPAIELADEEEPACLPIAMCEANRDDVASSEDVPDSVMTETETDEVPTRADRLSSAIRLTREAAQAWADLIQESPDEACPAH